jgi:predicted DsbA family dithiol-disulfide isomerase
MHPGACLDSRYAIASENQGKFWEMNNALFDKKPKTEKDILEIAKSLKFDVDKLQKDANSAETYDKLSKDIEFAYSHGIEATPTITIGKKKVVGLKPYEEFVNLVKEHGTK